MRIQYLERIAAILVAALLSISGGAALADSHEPPPQGVLETFLCSYLDGKDRDDLNSAIEFHLKQAQKAGITPVPAYLWTKFKGSADADLAWHNVYESMEAFGNQMDAEAASSEMAAANDRYLSVVRCTPLLGRVAPVHQQDVENDGTSAFVVSYACRTFDRPDPDAIGDLNRHIGGVFGSMGANSPLGTFGVAPVTADPAGPNAVYINVFRNVSHWTAYDNELRGSESGQMLVRHFSSMLNCANNMWSSEQVIGGAE